MSASEDQIKKLVENNPNVDEKQLGEMRKLHDELEREGISKPRYAIVSPYERKPLRQTAQRSWHSRSDP
jgi:hypothetical protein